jgi:hypothetical protein
MIWCTDEWIFREPFNKLGEEETRRGCVERMRAVVGQRYFPDAFDRTMEDVVQRLLRGTRKKL